MSLRLNSIPALSEEFLETIERVKNDIRALKKAAYGSGCNSYDGSHQYNPKSMSIDELDRELSNILSDKTLEKIASEVRELRPKLDYHLIQTVVEKILPQWVHPRTLVEYDLYIAGRDMKQIDSKKDPRRGRKDRQEHIIVLPVEEWADAWKEYVFSDERVDRGEIVERMPEGTDCLLSTNHRFYGVKKVDKVYRRRNNNHNNGFLQGYEIVDNKSQVDCRLKSGAEFFWKLAPYLTGLEVKQGKTRESIVDVAGIRLICLENSEQNSTDLYQNLMNNYTGDCRGSLILNTLSNQNKQRNEFIRAISGKAIGFIEKVLVEEDRPDLLSPEDVEKLQTKYYLEMLIPFCATLKQNDSSSCFGRNVFNILSYQVDTFKKIHEKRDDFIYKGRAEDWRDEHYSYLEWRVLEMLAPAMLTGDSFRYIKTVVRSKIHKKSKIYKIKDI